MYPWRYLSLLLLTLVSGLALLGCGGSPRGGAVATPTPARSPAKPTAPIIQHLKDAGYDCGHALTGTPVSLWRCSQLLPSNVDVEVNLQEQKGSLVGALGVIAGVMGSMDVGAGRQDVLPVMVDLMPLAVDGRLGEQGAAWVRSSKANDATRIGDVISLQSKAVTGTATFSLLIRPFESQQSTGDEEMPGTQDALVQWFQKYGATCKPSASSSSKLDCAASDHALYGSIEKGPKGGLKRIYAHLAKGSPDLFKGPLNELVAAGVQDQAAVKELQEWIPRRLDGRTHRFSTNGLDISLGPETAGGTREAIMSITPTTYY